MGIQIEYAGASAFMETSSIYDTPNEAYFTDDGGATWTSGLANFGADMHGVVTFSGQCEIVDDGGGGSGDVCSQGTESNNIENGWGNVSLLTYANDFVVAQNEEFTLEQFSVNFLLNPGQPIVSADIYFYEDTGGNGPGAEIPGTSSLGVVPDSQQAVGSHPAGFDLIQGVWTLATPITFEGNASGETVYWMGIQIKYAGASAFMETSSIYDTPNEAYFTDDGGATWTSGLANFGADMHGVVTFSGQCEIVDDGGGGSGDVCSQGTESNNIENGWGNVSLLTYANDFVVAQNEEFTLEQFSVNFLLNPGQPIVSADIYFYEDTGGNGPGAEIPGTSSLGVVPDSQQAVGSHPAGFDLIQGVWTLATPITFEGNASGETVYWMGIQIEYAGASAFMETSSIYDTPNEAYFTDDGGATWTSGLANFGADMHGVVTFSGQCEIVDDGGGGSGDVCSQGTESNNIENGWGNVSLLTYANDFVVAQNEEFTLEQFSVNFLLNPGQPIVSADIYFYEDTGGNGPGAEIPGTSSLGVVPDSQQAVGSHPAGFDLIQGVWTLATPITFEGNASGETVYWMGIQIKYAGASAFMETSSIYDTPNEAYFTDDGGATWTSGLANFGADMHGVVTFSGQCEIVDDGGGGSGDVCSQGTESNNIENGWGNVSLLTYANDFVVAQNEEFTLEQFSVNFLLNPGQPIVSADIYFYEDTGGNGPGAEIPGTSSLGVVPDSQQAVGSHPAGFDLIQGVWTLATPITFEGNASGETVYWMGIQIEYAGASAFMETSSVYDTPNEAYFTDDGGATWTSGLANFGADMHGVVTFSGQCEFVDDGGGDVADCTPMLDCTDGDMITNVNFQEIDNTTTCSPNGYGDYTDTVAVVEAGETYLISVSVGDGWSSESVSVWIDFDNNGSFDEDEFYFIGTGSGEALLGDIAIPADAANGDYRMRVRVVADGADSATWDMSCDEDQFFGETEDYTIEVVEGSGGIDYCTPEGINSARYINNFATTGGSENISNMGSGFSTGGYGDFTSMKVKQVQTNEVDFTVGIEGGTAGFRVWVDWNQDGVFDTTEEVAYQSSSYSSSHTGSFMIPEDAMPGETRMRIVSHWLSSSGTIDPCATGFDYGEFEDYTLEVVALEACSEAIAGTVVGDTEMEVCANAPFSMSVEGNSEPASGLTRTWQSSPAGDNTWTDLGQSSSTITIAGISEPMDYRYHVECENGDSDDSEVISVSLNPNTDECYCIPEGTNSGRYIDNFSTTDGTENISNMGSGYSAFGYGDFYDTHTIAQEQGETVGFSVDIVGGTAGFRVWVDWNQDGSFDITEEVAYSSSGYSGNHTETITVPADALEGDTRMRIVSHWLSTSGNIDPCETGFEYGEFEDYKFTVIASSGGDEDCSGTPDAGVASVNPESGNVNTTYNVSASDFSLGNGITYQWQSNTDGAGWENEGDLLDQYASHTATAPAEYGVSVEWRLEVTCTLSSETS